MLYFSIVSLPIREISTLSLSGAGRVIDYISKQKYHLTQEGQLPQKKMNS